VRQVDHLQELCEYIMDVSYLKIYATFTCSRNLR